MWDNNPDIAPTFMQAIHIIGEQLAKCDGTALANITQLTRQGIDLSKYKLVEIKEDGITEHTSNQEI
jgi:hypothetical protein